MDSKTATLLAGLARSIAASVPAFAAALSGQIPATMNEVAALSCSTAESAVRVRMILRWVCLDGARLADRAREALGHVEDEPSLIVDEQCLRTLTRALCLLARFPRPEWAEAELGDLPADSAAKAEDLLVAGQQLAAIRSMYRSCEAYLNAYADSQVSPGFYKPGWQSELMYYIESGR
jgi:hypothetical protein